MFDNILISIESFAVIYHKLRDSFFKSTAIPVGVVPLDGPPGGVGGGVVQGVGGGVVQGVGQHRFGMPPVIQALPIAQGILPS